MKLRALTIFIIFTTTLSGLAMDVLATTATEYAVIINLSGRQRMLTQKMSKEMLLIAAKINVNQNREGLKKTAKLFDSTLKGLRDGNKKMGLPPTKSKVILKQLAKVANHWSKFKSIVDSVAKGGSVPVAKVAALNLPLLKNMNTAVRLYEKEAKKATGRSAGVVINLAGKQRMLTQKMSKEMLLVFLNNDSGKNTKNLKMSASLFGRTLKGLRNGDADLELPPTKNIKIIAQLDTVSSLWSNFKPLVDAVTDIDAKGVSTEKIIKMSELNLPLLKEMNKAVKMYEQEEK